MTVSVQLSGREGLFSRAYYENISLDRNNLRGSAPIEFLKELIPGHQVAEIKLQDEAAVFTARMPGIRADSKYLLKGQQFTLEFRDEPYEIFIGPIRLEMRVMQNNPASDGS